MEVWVKNWWVWVSLKCLVMSWEEKKWDNLVWSVVFRSLIPGFSTTWPNNSLPYVITEPHYNPAEWNFFEVFIEPPKFFWWFNLSWFLRWRILNIISIDYEVLHLELRLSAWLIYPKHLKVSETHCLCEVGLLLLRMHMCVLWYWSCLLIILSCAHFP